LHARQDFRVRGFVKQDLFGSHLPAPFDIDPRYAAKCAVL
jgi:hypothetical protein